MADPAETSDPTTEPVTMTHARIRAAQGDYRRARAIVGRLLERSPRHVEARQMLRHIDGLIDRRRSIEAPVASRNPKPGDPALLRARFRDALKPAPAPISRPANRLDP